MSTPISRLNDALEGRYRIEREIGVGGSATVYLTRDLKHDREVALKVLHPELASEVGAQRFLQEIRISAALSHPHILTLIDSGQVGDLLYFVLPRIEGESLRERIDRDGRMPLEEAVRLVEQVASALDYAHGAGVVHRDVKPSNVLIHRGEAMVTDFGIATGLETSGGARLTSEGSWLGSPQYMSPEQARGEAVERRTDVWSLACLAHEVLAGSPPFPGDTVQAVIARVLTQPPVALEKARPGVPAGIAAAVRRGLQKDPVDRFDTAGALAAALRASLPASVGGSRWIVLAAAAAIVVLFAAGAWRVTSARNAELAAQEAVAAVEDAIEEAALVRGYRLATTLPGSVDDSIRQRIVEAVTLEGTVTTDPPGATVSWRPLQEAGASWETLGTTPITTRIPATPVLMRLTLDGHEPRLAWSLLAAGGETIPLRPEGAEPENALFVPGGLVSPGVLAGGIWRGDDRRVGDYLLDAYETTNREYQEFVNAEGYERPELWEHPFVGQDRTLSRSQAMAAFVDRTGRPGPATWELGRYREGTGEHPVTGVSWYEAAAYARFVDRELPTLYHWYRAAVVQRADVVVPLSNLPGDSLAPVGTFPGVTVVGAFDMAGNAREWVANAAGEYRLTQGGSWGDEAYAFGLAQPLSPLDRSEHNGFRLMTDLGDPALLEAAARPVAYFERDFASESPVSDEVFDVFRDVYAHDETPLNATVEATDTVHAGVVRERITFDAGYGGERMVLYLFLPTNGAERPLQTVLYFPGSGALSATEFGVTAAPHTRSALVVGSGRALAYPVIDGSYERQDEFDYPLQDATNAYRDRVIAWYRDVTRTLDYLETRSELDTERLAYFGLSLGGRMGAIMLALEPRFKTGVLLVAGLSPKPTQPVVDPFNFLPRVRQPVLVLSGQYDPIYPLDESARPFFEGLGSEVKEHYVSQGAHFVPWPELAREVQTWLDRHLGPVR